jgi:hypothetical protein
MNMRTNRRGTVLVLILGALALISVITVVYVTIGQGDRRSAAVTVRRDNVEQISRAFAEYATDVIASAVFAHHVDGAELDASGSLNAVLVRNAFDKPYTMPWFRSTGGVAGQIFNPTGSYSTRWTAGGVDPRAPGSPWLASSTPTWLEPPATPSLLPSTFRERYLEQRDWYHITNIAPNGRFVNLWALRNNFDAQSGTGTDPSGRPRLSQNLSLLDDNGQPTNALPFSAGNADLDVPAHWTMFQRRAFRPAYGPWYNGGGDSPGNVEYPLYQWVDADGDGFLDSRLFELVDDSDPLNIRALLPRDGRYRWFAGVRIVDLSSMANINTGTDFRIPARAEQGISPGSLEPTMAAIPTGRTPADIDVRRLLTMTDRYYLPTLPPIYGYQLFALGDPYQQYDAAAAHDIGDSAHFYLDRWLRPQLGFGTVMNGDDRAYYYEDFGSRPSAGLQQDPAGNWYEMSRLFGSADLLELLTFRTINSPTSSRLEEIVSGQGASLGANFERRLSVLRDNRSLQSESLGLNLNQALARAHFDVRQHLTTLSWTRPLRPNMLTTEGHPAVLTDSDLQVDAYLALRDVAGTDPKPENRLFRAYADALLPHSWRQNAWLAPGATMHYGDSPELALRTAAHLAANMAAAFTADLEHYGYTLLIDNSFFNDPLLLDVTKFPFWVARNPAPPPNLDRRRSLDLGQARLAPNNNAGTLSARAINIYGVDAQPFITQVVSIQVLTDAPTPRGDDEFDPLMPNQEITIAGGINVPLAYPGGATGLNPDNLGQFIAFQLHNPFDVEIALTDATGSFSTGFSDYYLEFNGHLFRLADYTASTTPEGERITLKPGETRIAIVASHEWSELEDQWDYIAPLPRPPGGAELLRRFLDRQFSIDRTFDVAEYDPGELTLEERVRPWILRRMNPTTGLPENSSANLFSGAANSPAKGEVLLWRTILRNSAATPTDPGFREAHMLADRMRDPALATGATRATLDRSPSNDNHSITNAIAAQQGTGDNRGYTIALWGSLKRSDDPGVIDPVSGQRIVPRGGIPAYCIEAKWGATGIPTPGSLQNHPVNDPANPDSLRKSDFSGSPPIIGGPPGQIGRPTSANAGMTVALFLAQTAQSLTASPANPQPTIVPTLSELPQDRNRTAQRLGNNLDGRGYAELYPEILLNKNRFDGKHPAPATGAADTPILRLGDMLMPLAIGPSHDPAADTVADPYAGRITLSEALALALNYSTPQATDPNFGVLHNLGAPAGGTPGGSNIPGALDRGNLVLDRFAPYERVGGTDHRRFPGIPLALHILNIFNVTADSQPGSLTQATPGLVNINTAPSEVLRLVPLLSPTTEETPGGPEPFLWQTWLRRAGVATGTTLVDIDLAGAGSPRHSDIAAAVIAYRDKIRIFDRVNRANVFTNSPESLLFSNPSLQNGRSGTTAIAGLREAPGFASRGEIMAVIDRTGAAIPSNPAPPGASGLPIPNQIDFLGLEGRYGTPGDARPSGAPGLTTARHEKETGSPQPPFPKNKINQIPDSYDEQLLIANAAMGSISVRSDVFAVWIVLHGYQRSDTENLGPDDPLVPTVAKRFVMVVDRSNVTRLGEKPRVLLFKEVPLN